MIMADKDNDGIIMLYVKDKKAYPIVISKEQRERLEVILPTALIGKLRVINDRSVYDIEWEKLGDANGTTE